MNILFLLKTYVVGGLENVTTILANKFKDEGHSVVLWAFYEGDSLIYGQQKGGVPIVYGDGLKYSANNVRSLRETIVYYRINVVVNQWGLPFVPAYTLKKAVNGLDIKIIAVYHNDPSTNGRMKEVESEMGAVRSALKLSFLKGKLKMFRAITSASMRYVYRNSDKYMLLSPSYISGFQEFTGLKDLKKLVVQTCPVTTDYDNYITSLDHKEKEVIYVGRLDFNQKRVSRVIETWALLEDCFSNWHLTIVGDGIEKKNLERMVNMLRLRNVRFEGFQQTRPYYERASLLLLTSEFEGLPLVLTECMHFGVVPIVYDSFSAVYDIIEDGKDGMIVPKTDRGFDAALMAEKIARLMSDDDVRREMAMNAIEKRKKYSIDNCYRQWMMIMGK